MPLSSKPRVAVSRKRARLWAVVALLLVLLLELMSGHFCGRRDAWSQVIALGFLLIPLSPSLIALATPNPLCSVAASISVAAWILYAFHFECVGPHQDGNASMVYLGVWFYGFLSALAAALSAALVLRLLGVRVSAP